MSYTSRPLWRLFLLALLIALFVSGAESQTPALTAISDTLHSPRAAVQTLRSSPAMAVQRR